MLIRLLLGIIVGWLAMLLTRTISLTLSSTTLRPPQRPTGKVDQRRQALAKLRLEDSASAEEIQHAYKQLTHKYHPDRVAHLGPELVELTEERFKEISAAYEYLSTR